MTFEVKWNPNAAKIFSQLSKDVIKNVFKKLDKIKEDPFRYLEHFEGKDFYKLRFGDYRALVDVDFHNKVLKIEVFDKRSRVYKK